MIIATDPEPLRGSFYVRFYPALQKFFGSKHVPVIVDRLEYWFQKDKFKNGFFKFLEPCNHYLYRPGDSWQEEIGVCRKAFNTAFNLIGVTYESKTAFLAEDDPFKGKLYVRYYDRKTNQTFFIRNHEFARDFFKSIFTWKSQSRRSEKTVNKAAINEPKERGGEGQKGRSRNGHYGRSCEGSYIDKQITTNNSSLGAVRDIVTEEDTAETKLEEEMKKIWIEKIGSYNHGAISKDFGGQMKDCLANYFGNSLEKWREYCATIASSKFLMGEMPNTKFKIWLSWAIKPETIERIQAKGFTLGDREKPKAETDWASLCEESFRNQSTGESRLFHAFMREKYGDIVYYNWFRSIRLEQESKEQIKLLVPSKLHKQRIETHYSVFLQDALCLAFKKQTKYQITVAAN